MNRWSLFPLLCCLLLFTRQRRPTASTENPAIILKLDDAWYEDGLLHPGWMEPESRWVEFRKIVDFLIEQYARFVTPAEHIGE